MSNEETDSQIETELKLDGMLKHVATTPAEAPAPALATARTAKLKAGKMRDDKGWEDKGLEGKGLEGKGLDDNGVGNDDLYISATVIKVDDTHVMFSDENGMGMKNMMAD